jgi:hypothetical protein
MKQSAGVEFVWTLAAREAVAVWFPEIQPEHMLEGLLRFAEYSASELHGLVANEFTLQLLLQEAEELKRDLQARGIDPAPCRRDIRSELGHGPLPLPANTTVHRSRAVKERFEDAARRAKQAGRDGIGPLHLLEAILAAPTPVMARVFQKESATSTEPALATKDIVFPLRLQPLGNPKDSRQVVVKSLARWFAHGGLRNLLLVGSDHSAAVAVLAASLATLVSDPPPQFAEVRCPANCDPKALRKAVLELQDPDRLILLLPELTRESGEPWDEEFRNLLAQKSPRLVAVLSAKRFQKWSSVPGWRSLVDVVQLDPPSVFILPSTL